MTGLVILTSIFMTCLTAYTTYRIRAFPIATLAVSIVWLYLVFGPIVVLLNEIRFTDFSYLLYIFINLLFFLPLLIFLQKYILALPRVRIPEPDTKKLQFGKLIILTIFVFSISAVFIDVVVNYGLLVRRIGHDALMEAQANVPLIKLIIYRFAVETSFFLSAGMLYLLKNYFIPRFSRYLFFIVYFVHLMSFSAYFLINSRLQFLILILINLIVFYRHRKFPFLRFGLIFVGLLVGLTLLRELFLEDNNRLSISRFSDTAGQISLLIANRINVLEVFQTMKSIDYTVLTGYPEVFFRGLYFNLAFFVDREFYDTVKESLITSNSVYVYNMVENSHAVDFPKTIIVESIFVGSVFILPIVALFYGYYTLFICKLFYIRKEALAPFIGLFLVPFILEFEKELTTILINPIKWGAVVFIFWFVIKRFKLSNG